jgi:glucokinase
MSGYSIGVDLGGTNLRVAAVDTNGVMLERVSLPADYSGGPGRVVEHIIETLEQIRASLGRTRLGGVGVGVPGFIDIEHGVVLEASNLPGFTGFAIRDELQRRLDTLVVLENDANAAALGEMWMGAGRGVKDLILLTLGTGIGGGIISHGQILHGFLGMAGEIGHMTIYPDGNPCGCGNTGCLEKHASASAIAALGRSMGLGSEISAAEVFGFAERGDPRALAVFESVGRALGIALASLVNIFNFPLYLLSGGPLPAWDYFAPAMFAELDRRSYTRQRTGTRVEKALLGSDAGLVGAAYLPVQRTSYTEMSAAIGHL